MPLLQGLEALLGSAGQPRPCAKRSFHVLQAVCAVAACSTNKGMVIRRKNWMAD